MATKGISLNQSAARQRFLSLVLFLVWVNVYVIYIYIYLCAGLPEAAAGPVEFCVGYMAGVSVFGEFFFIKSLYEFTNYLVDS
jgi:hypothetical protein